MLRWIGNGLAGSDSFFFKLLRLVLLLVGLSWGYLFISLPLTWRGQMMLGLIMVAAGILLGRTSGSAFITSR